MIFNLNLIKTVGAERLIFNIVSRHPRCFGGIFAIVDTGSPRTIISAKDAYLLKIPTSDLEESKPITGFGKGGIPCRILKNFKFYIKSADNQIKQLEMPIHVVDIPALSKLSQEMKENAFKVPSIIGLDFLVNQKFKLFINFEKDSCYFEE
jgi:hypothetical protein